MPGNNAYLVDVACGRQPAEKYIKNGRVLNIYSGELLTDTGVAIADGRVAYVGPATGMIGPETRILDAEDGVLVPGYVDPHAHFDNLLTMRNVAEAILPLGTTAVVNDTLAIVARFGAAGLTYLQAAAKPLPLHTYYTVPISGWAPELEDMGYFAGLGLSDSELAMFLADERVVGTSEFLPWRRLLSGDPCLMARLELARVHGKLCSGHNPGAKADQVQALAAAGLTDCHEALSAREALDRLRAGMYVVMRHGPARYDLPVLAPLVMQEGVDRSRLMLSPDWLPPNDLVSNGHMDFVIAAALEAGLPPLEVYRMATINPARYFRIEDRVGAIAPGRYADILCLDSLLQPRPRWVMACGKVVAREGGTVNGWLPQGSEPQLPPYRPSVLEAHSTDFQVATDRAGDVMVAAIEIVDKTVTQRIDLQLPVRDGFVTTVSEAGQILKMAMPKPGGGFAVGFLAGVGACMGALSTSLASEPYNTLVIGSNDDDMAMAYNRMVSLGGGVVAVQDGRIEVELSLGLGGFFSHASAGEVAAGIDAVNQWALDSGSPLENIFLTHHFLTYIGVPFFRMTPWGMYDVKGHVFIPALVP